MKNFLKYIFLFVLFILSCYFAYKYFVLLDLKISSNELKFASFTFLIGLSATLFFSEIMINQLQDTLKVYKRQLEKTSIGSNESSSKVKVLESKIKVLEKALEDALNK